MSSTDVNMLGDPPTEIIHTCDKYHENVYILINSKMEKVLSHLPCA